MNNNKALISLGVGVLAVLVVAWASVFTVPQTTQALLLRFGNPVRVVRQPGLHVKLPFIEQAFYFDNRILDLDPPEEEVLLADQKRLNVDVYMRFRITDPLKFYQTMGSESLGRNRMSGILLASLRTVLGSAELGSVLSARRADLMHSIQEDVASAAKGFGVKIVDVRIGRADLPAETSTAVYNRMKSEREREAKEIRAEGYQAAAQIRADAERQRTVILADAAKQAEILRGDADAQSIKIWAQAAGQAPRFFTFYRSLQAYRKALAGSDTTMVLSPDSAFFRYLENPQGQLEEGPATPASREHRKAR